MTTSQSSTGMLDKNGQPMYNNTGAIITNLDKYRIGSRRERKIMEKSSMRLIDFIEDWLKNVKEVEVKTSTYNLLQKQKKALSEYPLANIRVADISPDDFAAYVKQLTEHGYARTTIKCLMALVKSAILWACNQRIITFNPCLGSRLPSKERVKKPARDIDAFTPEEQKRLRFVLRTHEHDSFYAMELMLETGIRVGECLALDWNDVDIEKHRLYIHKTVVNEASGKAYIREGAKTDSSKRVVPLSPRAVEVLKELAAKSETDYLFCCNKNTWLKYSTIRKWVIEVCKRASVPYRSPHAFRHTFATNQFYKGTNIKILSKLLGHSNTSITYNTYIHLFGDEFNEMLKAVGN